MLLAPTFSAQILMQ